MTQHEHQGPQAPRRGNDADARGEHNYAPHRQERGESTTPVRAPNTYAAGENGTQQVTTHPPTDAPADSGPDAPR